LSRHGGLPREAAVRDVRGLASDSAGNVIVAGLSNEEFSSSLRSIPFPFQQAGKGASKALADAGDGFYAEGLSKEYYIGNLAGQSSLGAQAWPRIMRHRPYIDFATAL